MRHSPVIITGMDKGKLLEALASSGAKWEAAKWDHFAVCETCTLAELASKPIDR